MRVLREVRVPRGVEQAGAGPAAQRQRDRLQRRSRRRVRRVCRLVSPPTCSANVDFATGLGGMPRPARPEPAAGRRPASWRAASHAAVTHDAMPRGEREGPAEILWLLSQIVQ
jgi:hypothetical protein